MSYRSLPPHARRAFKRKVAYEQGGMKLQVVFGWITAAPCLYCQWWFPIWALTFEHLINRRDGGTSHRENLALACAACNGRRNDREMGQHRPVYVTSWATGPKLNRWRRKRLRRGLCLSRKCSQPETCPRCHVCDKHAARRRACPAIFQLEAPPASMLACRNDGPETESSSTSSSLAAAP